MRISTITQNLRIDNSITSIQRKIADAQLQISTGKLSQVYSGFEGQDVRLLITLKEQRTSVDSYVDTITNTQVKTKTIDASLVTFTDITQDLRKKLYEQVEGLYDNSALALQTFANAAIDQLTNLLNQTADGKYLFNGTDTDTQPMINSATTKAAYVQPRIDEGVDVTFGELANDDAFEEVFEVMYAFANVNFQAGDDANYEQLVNWGIGKVEAAFELINDMVGQNGVIGAQMDTRKEAHQDSLTLLETQILDIEEIDPYEAVSTFQTLQAQLEASFQTTSVLRGLSLTRYL